MKVMQFFLHPPWNRGPDDLQITEMVCGDPLEVQLWNDDPMNSTVALFTSDENTTARQFVILPMHRDAPEGALYIGAVYTPATQPDPLQPSYPGHIPPRQMWITGSWWFVFELSQVTKAPPFNPPRKKP